MDSSRSAWVVHTDHGKLRGKNHDKKGVVMAELAKPPLGLTPRAIHDFNRIREIVEAIERYADAEKPIPLEWVDELKDLLKIC